MCGRYTLTVDADGLAVFFQLDGLSLDWQPRYNIAPDQHLPVIINNAGRRELAMMRWGLIPHWFTDLANGPKMINARAETVAQKPAFRNAYWRRRCLVPADGFYEWQPQAGRKLPHRIILPDNRLFAFAGIWERWVSPAGQEFHSYSIITVAANQFMQAIHHRMPVMLADPKAQQQWLESEPHQELADLLQPYQGEMKAYPVSTLVNSPRIDNQQCIAAKTDEAVVEGFQLK